MKEKILYDELSPEVKKKIKKIAKISKETAAEPLNIDDVLKEIDEIMSKFNIKKRTTPNKNIKIRRIDE